MDFPPSSIFLGFQINLRKDLVTNKLLEIKEKIH